MTKHPLDHDRGPSKGRLEKFTAVEKADKPHDATKDLQKRPRSKGEGKVQAFTRIERTGTAD